MANSEYGIETLPPQFIATVEARSGGAFLEKAALRVFNMGLIPEIICKPLAPYYFDRALGGVPIR